MYTVQNTMRCDHSRFEVIFQIGSRNAVSLQLAPVFMMLITNGYLEWSEYYFGSWVDLVLYFHNYPNNLIRD